MGREIRSLFSSKLFSISNPGYCIFWPFTFIRTSFFCYKSNRLELPTKLSPTPTTSIAENNNKMKSKNHRHQLFLVGKLHVSLSFILNCKLPDENDV